MPRKIFSVKHAEESKTLIKVTTTAGRTKPFINVNNDEERFKKVSIKSLKSTSNQSLNTVRSAVQRSAVQCSAVQCGAVRCSAVRCSAVRCSAVQRGAVQRGAAGSEDSIGSSCPREVRRGRRGRGYCSIPP